MKRRKQDGVYFFWSASIVICMLIALFTLGFASCKKGTPAASPSAPASESPEPSPTATGEPPESNTPDVTESPAAQNTGARLGETADLGQEYIDKFIFLGDSTTYGLGYYDVVADSQVWTPENGTLTLAFWSTVKIVYPDDGTEIPINEASAKKQPEYLMITLGVNGVSFMDETYFTEEYTKLVQAVQETSPDTRIILNSIYPISAAYPAENGITNAKIEAAKGWIERIANTLGVRYLDSASVLKNENGALPETLNNGGDGLHLNTDGFNLVINYIRTHGYQ
ncbi:MAG: SGNH/GDSL hydrolase family protein [Oscillospiraceae bacterium]|jgi:hypothetical protein|nr:SGNH/GDSL hydrolase family protein [Oscillospiraceae bacterium]